jgi:hypothetical protein
MEDIGLLDPADEVHIWCLHYVFQPRINSHLQQFHEGWNHKPIRTANNQSPVQLWYSGLYSISNSEDRIVQELHADGVQVV